MVDMRHGDHEPDHSFTPEQLEQLTADLFEIYQRTGKEVTYVDKHGKRRPYWPNRYRQALQAAVHAEAVDIFVESLVTRPEPSRGFGYLRDAGRFDITVEWLVADPTRSYHSCFSDEAVKAVSQSTDSKVFLSATRSRVAGLRLLRPRALERLPPGSGREGPSTYA
jgi:hypothetical protein